MVLRSPFLSVLLGLPLLGQTPLPRSVPELRQLFRDNCSRCHGPDGSARDAQGRRLAGLDFTSSPKVKHLREEERVGPGTGLREMRSMARTIRRGIFFGKVMPAWRDLLTEEEAMLMLREVIMKAERGKPIGP